MPEVTYDDRCMFATEASLWAILAIMQHMDHDDAWSDRITKVRNEIKVLACELRDYNDQFETADD